MDGGHGIAQHLFQDGKVDGVADRDLPLLRLALLLVRLLARFFRFFRFVVTKKYCMGVGEGVMDRYILAVVIENKYFYHFDT